MRRCCLPLVSCSFLLVSSSHLLSFLSLLSAPIRPQPYLVISQGVVSTLAAAHAYHHRKLEARTTEVDDIERQVRLLMERAAVLKKQMEVSAQSEAYVHDRYLNFIDRPVTSQRDLQVLCRDEIQCVMSFLDTATTLRFARCGRRTMAIAGDSGSRHVWKDKPVVVVPIALVGSDRLAARSYHRGGFPSWIRAPCRIDVPEQSVLWSPSSTQLQWMRQMNVVHVTLDVGYMHSEWAGYFASASAESQIQSIDVRTNAPVSDEMLASWSKMRRLRHLRVSPFKPVQAALLNPLLESLAIMLDTDSPLTDADGEAMEAAFASMTSLVLFKIIRQSRIEQRLISSLRCLPALSRITVLTVDSSRRYFARQRNECQVDIMLKELSLINDLNLPLISVTYINLRDEFSMTNAITVANKRFRLSVEIVTYDGDDKLSLINELSIDTSKSETIACTAL